MPERSEPPSGAANVAARTPARPLPEPSNRTLIPRIAATLIPVLQFWTFALWRGPRAAQREDAPQDPHEQRLAHVAARLPQHRPGQDEDPGADDGPDDDEDQVPQAQRAGERGSRHRGLLAERRS